MKPPAASLLCLGALAAHAQSHIGIICGTVENELGQPAAHVRIVAYPEGPTSMILPEFQTDASGHSCATNLEVPGNYAMTASRRRGRLSRAPGFRS